MTSRHKRLTKRVKLKLKFLGLCDKSLRPLREMHSKAYARTSLLNLKSTIVNLKSSISGFPTTSQCLVQTDCRTQLKLQCQ